MKKLYNVIMLPAKTDTIIVQSKKNKMALLDNPMRPLRNIPNELRHLYLVSDDEIKPGDWITDGKNIYKAPEGVDAYIGLFPIIASTDKNLCNKVIHGNISGQLPLISQSFIKEYVKSNGSIK